MRGSWPVARGSRRARPLLRAHTGTARRDVTAGVSRLPQGGSLPRATVASTGTSASRAVTHQCCCLGHRPLGSHPELSRRVAGDALGWFKAHKAQNTSVKPPSGPPTQVPRGGDICTETHHKTTGLKRECSKQQEKHVRSPSRGLEAQELGGFRVAGEEWPPRAWAWRWGAAAPRGLPGALEAARGGDRRKSTDPDRSVHPAPSSLGAGHPSPWRVSRAREESPTPDSGLCDTPRAVPGA